MSTPSSVINICSGVKLNKDYKHTIYFASASDQLNYFAGKVVKTFSAYSYLRKNWSIKVGANLEEARKWSYLYFRNGSGKYYYYFITDVQYINDNTVELSLEMDVLQTYLFDMTRHRCFVERQHVADDTIGVNTVDEGLELGEMRTYNLEIVSLSELCILVLSTYDPLTTTEEATGTVLGAKLDGVFSGLGVYAVNLSDYAGWATKLKLLDDYGKSDGIVSMWMYPKKLVNLKSDDSWTNGNVTHPVIGVGNFFQYIERNSKLCGGYVPRNNKLFTHPYNFLYVNNNSGGNAVLKYERFGDPTACGFKIIGSISPDGATVCYPLNYNGEGHAFEHGVSLGGFPTCAWNQDMYKLWLAQNQNQQNLALASGMAMVTGGIVAGIATAGLASGVGFGAAVSGINTISNVLAQKRDMSVTPPQAKGNHSASVNVSNGFHNFELKQLTVSPEYAKIIDDFFDVYGYKVNREQVPAIHVRQNWTYVKTVDCHISGNFCNEDQKKIQDIFDNGITWWSNGDNIGNYTLANKSL